jgi:hypothetical protein
MFNHAYLCRRYRRRFTTDIALAESGKRALIYLFRLGMCYAMAGRTADAHALLDPITQSNFPPLYRAIAHSVLGESEAVFAALEPGLEERSDWMYSLNTQPWLLDLHDDPRFQGVLAKLRLPAPAAMSA